MKAHRGRALLGLVLAAAGILALMRFFGPAKSLDRLPWYTAAEASSLLESLGPEGRARYLRNEWLDMGFVLIYSAFAVIAMGRVWERRLSARAVRLGQGLCLLPGLFDFAENSLVISALSRYPAGLDARISWLCLATPAKWLAVAAMIAAILAGAALDVLSPRAAGPDVLKTR
jgi:hypothetical protein